MSATAKKLTVMAMALLPPDLSSLAAAPKGKRKGKKAVEGQREFPLAPRNDEESREEKELAHLKELYPDEFAVLYEEALKKYKPLGGGAGEKLRRSAAELYAFEALRERRGIVK
jgi:hypothetical protein